MSDLLRAVIDLMMSPGTARNLSIPTFAERRSKRWTNYPNFMASFRKRVRFPDEPWIVANMRGADKTNPQGLFTQRFPYVFVKKYAGLSGKLPPDQPP
jgi:hypothetical protein